MDAWQQIKTIHSEAQHLAFDRYLCKGRVPPRLIQIISVAARLKALGEEAAKYRPDQPRAPSGQPNGGQWVDAGGGSGGGGVGGGHASPFLDGSDIDDPPLKPVYPEVLLLPFLRVPRILGAVRAFIAVNRRGADWTLGQFKTPKRWANQMEKRNWTPDEITQTIKLGKKYPSPNKVHPENLAIRYQNHRTGKFVVRDEVTREILQISGDDFIANKP
ncbi:MAG: colicin E5-related ribonuclease [Bdellovibrionales bacterium]|jgi:hypothetical protein